MAPHLELALEMKLAKSKALGTMIDLVMPLVKVLEMELNLVVLLLASVAGYENLLDVFELLKQLELDAVSKLESQLMTA